MPDQVVEEFTDELAEAANPVKLAAQVLAPQSMSGMARPTDSNRAWALMRVGVSRRDVTVWVAPDLRRGRRKQSPKQKERFAERMQSRALDPALEQNTQKVIERIEDMLDRIADHHGF